MHKYHTVQSSFYIATVYSKNFVNFAFSENNILQKYQLLMIFDKRMVFKKRRDFKKGL